MNIFNLSFSPKKNYLQKNNIYYFNKFRKILKKINKKFKNLKIKKSKIN